MLALAMYMDLIFVGENVNNNEIKRKGLHDKFLTCASPPEESNIIINQWDFLVLYNNWQRIEDYENM